MRRIRDIAPLAALIAALALPASAHAAATPGGQAVIRDCADDGQFSRQYSHADLDNAHRNLPTDIREYTDCKSLIEAALARQGGSGSPTGGGPGGATAGGAGGAGGAATTPSGAAGTPAAVAALNRATAEAEGGRASITANGQTIRPLASGLNQVPGAANALPSSVLAAIVAVMALCALGAIAATWRRWPALARAPLRLFRR
jgi:hypothetical protein